MRERIELGLVACGSIFSMSPGGVSQWRGPVLRSDSLDRYVVQYTLKARLWCDRGDYLDSGRVGRKDASLKEKNCAIKVSGKRPRLVQGTFLYVVQPPVLADLTGFSPSRRIFLASFFSSPSIVCSKKPPVSVAAEPCNTLMHTQHGSSPPCGSRRTSTSPISIQSLV